MDIVRFALLGLGAGAVYLLVAQGLVLVYRASGTINFAQGALGLVGASAFFDLRSHAGLPEGLAWFLALALAALAGVLVDALVLRRLRHASALARVMATLALLVLIISCADQRYGSVARPVRGVLPFAAVRLPGHLLIGRDRLVISGVALVITVGLAVVYRWTHFGLATTAVAENGRALAALGHRPDLVAAVNWGVASMLGTVAVILAVSLDGLFDNTATALLVVPALAAALVGGFSSFWLTLVGAFGIGICESEMSRYVATPGWSKSVPFLVIIGMMVVRGKALPLRGDRLERQPRVGTGLVRTRTVLAATLVGLIVVLLAPTNWVDAVTVTCISAVILLSLVVVVGFAGQLSLAQFALAGLGAWVACRVIVDYRIGFELAAILGVAAAAPFGAVIGLPALRARGANLAIATLGLGLVVEQLIFSDPKRTGGDLGTPIGAVHLFGVDVDPIGHPARYGFVVVVALATVALIVSGLRRGPLGRSMLAVRTNERAAAAAGINVVAVKLKAFAVSSAIASFGGILLAYRNPRVTFGDFGILPSITAVLDAVVGGVGYVSGAILGGFIGAGGIGQQTLGAVVGTHGNQYVQIVGSAAALATLMTSPDGLASSRLRRHRSYRSAGSTGAPAATLRPAADRKAATKRQLIGTDLVVRLGATMVLDGVTLTLSTAEVVGLIGPNGAGKTTLIDALTGFVRVRAGSVAIDATDLTQSTPAQRARSGVVRTFQAVELFSGLTVRENLLAAADRGGRGRRRRALLDHELTTLVQELGLADEMDQPVSALPLGRRRLVGIARALALRPAFLLLDEPAAGLDEEETANLANFVRRVAGQMGIGVLLVEHDVELVMRVCDRVIVLEQGRVIATGPPACVAEDRRVLEAYLGTADDIREASAGARITTVAGPVALQVDRLGAGYDRQPVLHDVSLTVDAGEIVLLAGPNGAGKSTTLLCIAGELDPAGGTVTLGGTVQTGPLSVRARQGLALVTEERSVFMDLTVAQNLRLGRGDPVAAYKVFPELRTLAGRRAGLLSGGEQQMLTVARALAAEPKVLLVDELSLGLAPLVVERLLDALVVAARSGTAVLMVEQQARRALRVADRVYVLNRGSVVLQESAAVLRANPERLDRSYLGAVGRDRPEPPAEEIVSPLR